VPNAKRAPDVTHVGSGRSAIPGSPAPKQRPIPHRTTDAQSAVLYVDPYMSHHLVRVLVTNHDVPSGSINPRMSRWTSRPVNVPSPHHASASCVLSPSSRINAWKCASRPLLAVRQRRVPLGQRRGRLLAPTGQSAIPLCFLPTRVRSRLASAQPGLLPHYLLPHPTHLHRSARNSWTPSQCRRPDPGPHSRRSAQTQPP
jgi:hypothetical protein